MLADASNERSFPSSAPSIKRLLPLQSFTPGPILYEVNATACSNASASNTNVPIGAAHISALFLFLSPSSSLSLLFVPLFKSSQASLSSLPISSFKSRQVGANSLAVSLSFSSSFLFSLCGCSPYIPPAPSLCFSKLSREKSLIYHFEGGKSALVYFHTHICKHKAWWIWSAVGTQISQRMSK